MGEGKNRFLDRFGIVLILILLLLLVSALRTDSAWWGTFSTALLAVTLATALAASNARPRTIRTVALVGLGATVLSAVSSAFNTSNLAITLVAIMNVLLAAVVPVVIGFRVARHERVNGHTIAGALCIYLLIGLLFGIIYRTIGSVAANPALTGALNGSSVDEVYYSFVTLSTLGFGDITPASDLARMFTITEALLGQLYLVTVVAMLVSRVGLDRIRQPRS